MSNKINKPLVSQTLARLEAELYDNSIINLTVDETRENDTSGKTGQPLQFITIIIKAVKELEGLTTPA